jgi:hypothetical protein
MSPAWIRVGGGVVGFGLIFAVLTGGLFIVAPAEVADAWTFIGVGALAVGIAVYALIEYIQTGRLDSLAGQFDTRTIVLMPVAIALNVVLGQAVGAALKIPLYLDSVGTILIAALGGPLPGLLTGLLSNLVWAFLAPPPFGSATAAPFAIVAAVVGLMAGVFARWGWLRPRPGASGRRLAVGGAFSIAVMASMAILALGVWQVTGDAAALAPESDESAFLILGWLAMLLVVGTAVGLVVLLFRRRDLAAAYILVAGVLTGITAAFIAAPIAASLFGGVTGSGADFLVAAFRQAGADLEQAVLGQSLVSDSIDKVITYFVVFLILGAMSNRQKARFPNGDQLLLMPEDEGLAQGDEPAD